ncbi:MAG: hypothetical protein OM95_05160 [Bdellovibrio sp. ArHS]|uniref:Spy/CpxP family protein refolding chaperone n=1 Tax=Bdellovibrio sp. ArHS TaxID=1569284 RepID=UPI000583222B|nr:Spy/CpxP family protein refolding chaperone [Bdellovibrio sp. ArHS]KHD89204.1 MAG: hypothetical protein OM95_05160 [Bdellovibrio sp. ArHS]
MKMGIKRKWPRVLGVALAFAGLGLMTGCHRSPEERINAVSEKIADKFDFNEQQKVLLKDITNELKKDFAEEKATRQSLYGDLKAMLLADELDKGKIKEVLQARQARMDARVDKYLDKVAVLHKSLTAEQKKELVEKIEKFHKKWE